MSTDIKMLDQIGEEFQELTEAAQKRLHGLFYQINTNLGGTSIKVHLNDADYQVAFKNALDEYRYSSSKSFYYTYGNLILEPKKQHYILHKRVDFVQQMYRGQGLALGTANGSFDSFGQAMLNSMLSGNANLGGTNGTFDLPGYETFMQYTTLMNKMFARTMAFRYSKHNSTLTIYQAPKTSEMVVLQVSVSKTIPELIDDQFSWNWLRKYTEAQARLILGEKYTLFGNIPGAQGGTQMKGQQLLQQGQQMVEQLQKDIQEYADSGEIAYPMRG